MQELSKIPPFHAPEFRFSYYSHMTNPSGQQQHRKMVFCVAKMESSDEVDGEGKATRYMKFRSIKRKKRKCFHGKKRWEVDREQAEIVEDTQNGVSGAVTARPIMNLSHNWSSFCYCS